MARNYYVYLTENSSDPESGTEHTNWIAFICTKVKVTFKNKNVKEDLPQHKSFEIKTGEFKFDLTFSGVKIFSMGTNAAKKTSYNSFMEFVGDNAKSGGSTVYAMVYMDVGDGNAAYMKFYDDDGTPSSFMQCQIKSYSFTFDATKGYATGTIKMVEEWG